MKINNYFEVDMRIHRVKRGESVSDIAKAYGINEKILERSNEIVNGERLSEGEELLILTPTRTYTARDGDSITRISLRFGTPISEIMRMNPHLFQDEINKGDIIAVKRDERPFGMGAANGIYYKGCPQWKFKRALPYTTYITVGSGIYDGERCYESFNGGEIAELALENGKLPILRIYDKSGGGFSKTAEGRQKHIDELIYAAWKGGYRGIDLAGGDFSEGYEEFLVELRGRMIGLDLILISEIDADTPIAISDFSDGAIFGFNKCGMSKLEDMGFDVQERRAFEKFANEGESTKTFIELPVFGYQENGGFVEVCEAIRSARLQTAITKANDDGKISEFQDNKKGRVEYNSLSNIATRLKILEEMGYMGISFDIGRCPISYLLLYDAMFKSVGYVNIEKKSRCNPGTAEAIT
jgi:LysM repeat protein